VTTRELVLQARARLVAAGIEPGEAAMDAELLAREVLGWDRARFLAHEPDPAPPSLAAPFTALVARRERREPVSGILGRREFWGLDFEITRDVLTPRPETEIIVEEAVARGAGDRARAALSTGSARSRRPPLRIADVGTGSGCLAVALALEFPRATVVATDVSAPALDVARRNATRHDVLDRIEFRLTSLLDGVLPPFDLVVSNPPYVPTADLVGLPPEVRDHEPRQALDGGADGLDAVRALVQGAAGVLAPGGWLIVEFGCGQEAGVRAAIAGSEPALDLVVIRQDLQGIPRTVVASRRGHYTGAHLS
jgi:release factor glutamine methyltransferase